MSLEFAVLFYVILSLASLATWFWMKSKWKNGEQPLAYRERQATSIDPFTVIAVFAIWAAVPWVVSKSFAPTSQPSLHKVQISCLTGGLMIAGIAVALFGGGYRPQELGISLQHWKADVRDGTVGCLAAFLPVFVLLLATSFVRSEETIHSFLQLIRKHPQASTICWVIVVAVIIAPLLEELLFRVVMQGALTARLGPRLSIPLVALAFSAVHGWPDSLPLIPLALVLGYVYHRRHSYLAVVVLHAIFNATNLLFALMTAENAVAGS